MKMLESADYWFDGEHGSNHIDSTSKYYEFLKFNNQDMIDVKLLYLFVFQTIRYLIMVRTQQQNKEELNIKVT